MFLISGQLFVIEGVDGSGKATQTTKLFTALSQEGYPIRQIEFPNYASPSSSLIKMYLNGDFGEQADAVNAYVASTFYAVDRFASYRQQWQSFYENGGILLADRYTTSNMIHQGGKITDPQAKATYLNWLLDFEYRLFALPEPTCTFFLDMPPAYSLQLRQERQTLASDLHNDIHEQDKHHLDAAYQNALSIANDYHWLIIPCIENDQIKTIDAIHQDIIEKIRQYLYLP